jgi:C_GCAxxG_C_C family probable redox protein
MLKETNMKTDEAERVFRSGFNCAQSVFMPFAEEYGLCAAEAARIASAFGAGMGRMQETCGAATGALMSLGLKFGFIEPDDQTGKDEALKRAKEFIAQFRGEFGTVKCRDLLGCDLNTDEGQKLHKEQNHRELVCMKCVKFAAATVESMSSEGE